MSVRLLLALVVALVVAACGSAGPGRTPVIVDTDLSSDDVIALLYVLQDPRVDLRAVTVSGTGLVHARAAPASRSMCWRSGSSRRARRLRLGDPADRRQCAARPMAARGDDLFGVTLPPASRRAEPDAVRLLATAIREAPS